MEVTQFRVRESASLAGPHEGHRKEQGQGARLLLVLVCGLLARLLEEQLLLGNGFLVGAPGGLVPDNGTA